MILTEEQRRDLEPLAGDGGYDRSPEARARMVLWRDEGYSAQETAEKAGTSKHTVYYWWRRYDREGPAGLETRPNPGPARQVSGRDRARILALTKQTLPKKPD
jgi:transposase